MDSSASDGFDPLHVCVEENCLAFLRGKRWPRALKWLSPHRSVCWQSPSALGRGSVGVAVCFMSVKNLTKMFLTKNLFLAICVDTTPWKEGKSFSMLLFSVNFDWDFEYN